MMNSVAMWVVLVSLGAAMVISPEPLLGKTAPKQQPPLEAVKEATSESLHYASEASRKTGELIRQLATSASDAVQRKAEEAAQAVKDGSQAGLNKIGLGHPPEPPSHFEQWQRGLQSSKDGAAALKDSAVESVLNANQGLQDTFSPYFGKLEEEKPPTSYSDVIKEKVVNTYDATEDATGQTVKAAKDKAGEAAKAVGNTLSGTRDWVADSGSNAAGFVQEKTSSEAHYAGEFASRIRQGAKDDVDAAGSEASATVKAAYQPPTGGSKETITSSESFVGDDESNPSYPKKILHAIEHAADIMRSKAKEAASSFPNVGQGLAYGVPDTHEKLGVGDYVNKAGEWIGVRGKKDVKNKAESYRDVVTSDWREEFLNRLGIHSEEDLAAKDVVVGNFHGFYEGGLFRKAGEALNSAAVTARDSAYTSAEKASDSLSKANEMVRQTKEAAVDGAKEATGRIYDSTNSAKDKAGHKLSETMDETPSDERDTKNGTANALKESCPITGALLLSSCRAAHLFVFSSVYGSSVWVTFVSGYLLSLTIPRHQFGFVQSRVFPVYLRLVGSGQVTILVSYIILHPWSKAGSPEKLQYLNLWAILLSTLANIFFLEPRATKVMFEKLKVEKEEGRGQDGFTGSEDDETNAYLAKIDRALKVLHGYSSAANLLSLLGMTWHLWHMSRELAI